MLVTYYWVPVIKSISSTKDKNYTGEAPFVIPGASTEHENNLRVKPIVEIKIYFMLEIDRCSCD